MKVDYIHNHKCYYDSASARGGDKCLMHVLVVSPARAATVATFAWTKLHAQIMS